MNWLQDGKTAVVTGAADDMIKNRPALSRLYPDYVAAYKAFIED